MRAAEEWFNKAAARVVSIAGAIGNWMRSEGPGFVAQEVASAAAGPIVGTIRNTRRVAAVGRAGAKFLSESSHLRNAAVGPRHAWVEAGLNADDVVGLIVQSSNWESGVGRGSVQVGGFMVDYVINQNRDDAAELVLNAWIRGR
jgi:hypothetical protein